MCACVVCMYICDMHAYVYCGVHVWHACGVHVCHVSVMSNCVCMYQNRCVIVSRSFGECTLSLLAPGWVSFPTASSMHVTNISFPKQFCTSQQSALKHQRQSMQVCAIMKLRQEKHWVQGQLRLHNGCKVIWALEWEPVSKNSNVTVCVCVWWELATSYAQSSLCLGEIHVRGKLEVMGQGLPGLHALLFGYPSNRSQNKQVFQIATTSLLRCIVCKTAIFFLFLGISYMNARK